MDLLLKFKEYLTQGKTQPSKVTVKNYIADLRKFIRWYETTYNRLFHPLAISPSIIEEFKKQTTDVRSLKRYLSSLRKFFQYLYQLGAIPANPFDKATEQKAQEANPWRIKDFKNFLYSTKASKLTIKNYIIDIRQFLEWLKEVIASEVALENRTIVITESDVYARINQAAIEEYKNRLLSERQLSPVSINRKLSSLRRYISWLNEKNIIQKDIPIYDLRAILQKETIDIAEPVKEASRMSLEDLKELASFEAEEKTEKKQTYSKFPPLRLLQKSIRGITWLTDLLFLLPIIQLIASGRYAFWKVNGRKVFAPANEVFTSSLKAIKAEVNTEPFITVRTKTELSNKIHRTARSITLLNKLAGLSKPIKKSTVANLPKSMYAPLKISTKNFSLSKKIIYHLKYTRPEWYKKYRSYPIVNYFHLAIFFIATTTIGFGLYQSFFESPRSQKPALASLPTAPPRILSFQGRLTDSSDTPITAATSLRFAIYNSQSASGSARLWEEEQYIIPDDEGVFSALLGKKSPISQNIFANNPSLYLGITVGSDSELQPRQPLATVAYAANAETLQGLVPITQENAGTTNVVLALDSAGNLTIGGNASPTFEATGGTFTLAGKVLTLATTEGSNGNILLAPDGTGIIDVQRPLQNTKGIIEVNDLFSITATSINQSALTINQNGTGAIISASAGGTARFTVDNTGAGTFADILTINGNTLKTSATTFNLLNSNVTNLNFAETTTSLSIASSSGTTTINNALTVTGLLTANGGATIPSEKNLTISGTIKSNLIPASSETYDIGAYANYWREAFLKNLFMSPSATNSGFWQRNNGMLTPTNTSDDLLIGGTTATAAKFQIVASSGNASTAGTLTFNTAGTIQTTNNQQLTVGGSTTGNITFSPLNGTGTTTINGLVGINTAIPVGTFDLRSFSGTTSIASISGNTALAGLVVDNSGNGDIFTASSSGMNRFVIKQNGFVGIGTTNPLAMLDLTGNASVSGNLTFNGAASIQTTANQTLTIGGTTTGNILLLPQNSTGMVGIGTINPGATLDIIGSIGTKPIASVSGQTSFAALSVNNNGSGDLLTASSSGTTKLRIDTAGNIFPGANGAQNIGSTTLNWGTIYSNNVIAGNLSGIQGFWQRNNSALSPYNINDDVLLGSTATISAKIGLINVAGGTPTASISANSGNNATFLKGDGTLGTTNMQTLTLGGATTGNIILTPNNASGGLVTLNGNLAINGTALSLANNTTIALGTSTTALNFGSNLLNLDTTNTRIGINTNAPVATLDVRGSSATTPAASISASSNFASLIVDNRGNGDLFTASYSGATKFTIDNNGNIGIAGSLVSASNYITAPNFVLNISGQITTGTWNATTVGTQYGGTGQNFSAITQGAVPYFSGIGTMSTLSAGTAGQCLVTNGASANPSWTNCISGSNSTNWWNQTNGALAPINSTVDFLLGGTASSSAKFAVLNMNNGTPTASISAQSGGGALSITATSLATQNSQTLTIGGATTGNIVLDSSSGSISISDAAAFSGLATFNAGATIASGQNLTFAGITTNNAILYSTSGSGIVTSANTNSTNLCLISGASAPSWATCPGSGTGASKWTESAGVLYPNNPTVDLLIGGTSTSSAKFAVLNINNGTPTASVSAISSGTGLTLGGDGSIQSVRNGTFTIGGNTTGDISFKPGNISTPSLYLQSTGNIGIGTTTPAFKFDINDNSSSPQLRIYNASSSDGRSVVRFTADRSSTQTYDVGIDPDGGASKIWGIRDITASGAPIRFALNQSGYLGIGTTTPTSELHVSRSLTVPVTGKALVNVNQLEDQDIFTASASGTTRFVIQNDGDVGIGIASPNADLHITGTPSSAHPNIVFGASSAVSGNEAAALTFAGTGIHHAGFGWFPNSTTNNSRLTLSMGGNTDPATMTTNVISFMGSGNVGIGTTSPTAVLDVNGTASISGGLKLTTTSTFQSTTNKTLTIGGDTTGNIELSPLAGSGYLNLNGDVSIVGAGNSNNLNLRIKQSSGNGGLLFESATGKQWHASVINNADLRFTETGVADVLTLKAGGRIGIGATAPTHNLEIASSSGDATTRWRSITSSVGGYSGRYQENGDSISGNSYFTYIANGGYHTNNGAESSFVAENQFVDVQALTMNRDHGFRFMFGDASSTGETLTLSELMRLTNTGLLGIGSTSPTSTLFVTRSMPLGATGKALAVFDQNENQDIFAASASGTTRFRIANNGDVTITGSGGSCTMTGAATTTTCGSDIRLKTNVQNLDNSLEKILSLRPVTYTWKDPVLDQSTQIGFIAQEVQQIYPNFVAEMPNGYLGVRYESFIMPAIKAIQELNAKVDNSGNLYTQRLTNLEKQVATASAAPVLDTSFQSLILSLVSRVASLEGTLTTAQLSTGQDATFSGTLRTDRLIAGTIDGLDDKLATLAAALNSSIYNSTASSSATASPSGTPSEANTPTMSFFNTEINTNFANLASLSGQLTNLTTDLGTFKEGIISLGPTSLTDVAVSNQLAIGSSMSIADNSINTFGEDLHIQPFRQGKVSFMANAVVIDTDGNITVDGDAIFNKDVKIKGKLAANIIVPVPDEDLIIQLSDSDNNKLAIHNGKGDEVVSINHLGDIVASGSGKFADLATSALNIVRGAQADTSVNESVASASAGTAIITAHQTERTIYSPHVKADSLIYITATSNTQGQVPYVARQTPENLKKKIKGSFTVQIPTDVSKDIKFNWWIVN